MTRSPAPWRILAALLLPLGLVACNGDGTAALGGDTAEEAPGDDVDGNDDGEEAAAGDEAFCDTALALGSPGEPEVDWETATEEEMAAAQQVFAQERLRPLVEDLRASAPEELQGDVDTLEQLLDDVEGGGELEAFFTGAGGEARESIGSEAATRCGWATVDVTAADYAFEGVPGEMEPGQVNFTFFNEGDEAHEMIVFRRADGVEESWEEILELPEEEAMQRAEFVAATFAPAGESGTAGADLQAGDYAMLCFIPVGTDASGEESGDGPPHFTEGMIATVTVE